MMQDTEATPLIRGRAPDFGLRAPSEEEEGEDGMGKGGGDGWELVDLPRFRRTGTTSWSSPDRVFMALLFIGFGMALTAGFTSATQMIDRFRPSSEEQLQQQAEVGGGRGTEGAGAGGGGGRGGAGGEGEAAKREGSSGNALIAKTIRKRSNYEHLPQRQQQQQSSSTVSLSAPVDASTATATTTAADSTPAVNSPPGVGGGWHELKHRDKATEVKFDSREGVDVAIGGRDGDVGATGCSHCQEAEGGRGWRSHDISRKNAGPSSVAGNDGDMGDQQASGPSISGGEDITGTKPNVFFILVDDMGYGDIGYQSTDLSSLTPNLDALMSGGRKLSNYYSLSLCTPARASLMTGRYPVRYGMQYGVIIPGAPWALPLSEKVLPEYMNEAGYESHMVGKWHLGSHNGPSLPSQRGFKTFLGYLNGENTYYTHKSIDSVLDGNNFYDFGYGNKTDYYDVTKMENGLPCSAFEKSGTKPWEDEQGACDPAEACYTDIYATDSFIGRASQVIKGKTPWDEEPLFLYLAHQSVHIPIGPAPEDDFTAEEKKLLNDVNEGTTSPIRTRFAGVLLYLDKKIGQLMDLLEEEGWLENSVIVVVSDNGGCPVGGGSNYPLRGSKGSVYDGGVKVPGIIWSQSHLPESLWGTPYDNIMHVTDWLPTLVSVVGGNISGSAGVLDGVDHWGSLTNDAAEGTEGSGEAPRTEMLYNWDAYLLSSSEELTENRDLVQGAFRQGSWKLLVNVWCSGYYSFDRNVVATDSSLDSAVTCGDVRQCEDCDHTCQDDPSYEYGDALFNLDDDPRESHNLIQEFPEIADRLRARAMEVVYSEYTGSIATTINTESYLFWKEKGWWMTPWLGKLPSDLSRLG